jgi:hypothetical protein
MNLQIMQFFGLIKVLTNIHKRKTKSMQIIMCWSLEQQNEKANSYKFCSLSCHDGDQKNENREVCGVG